MLTQTSPVRSARPLARRTWRTSLTRSTPTGRHALLRWCGAPWAGRTCLPDRHFTFVKLAHARELNAPAGAPFRLMATIDPDGRRWLDLEVARRRAVGRDERLAHNSALFRQPVTTLDEILARGLRVAALGEILDLAGSVAPDDDAVADASDLAF